MRIKKQKWLFVGITVLLLLSVMGCKEKEPSIDDREIFEEDLVPLSEEELNAMEHASMGEGIQEEPEMFIDEMPDEEMQQISGPNDTENVDLLDEDGVYTAKDEVAFYIDTYQKLPSNYITEQEAVEMGWDPVNGDLSKIAPGMSIGGDPYENENKMLPEKEGRHFYICDVEYEQGARNDQRIIYSDDGLVFYTEDYCKTFVQLY